MRALASNGIKIKHLKVCLGEIDAKEIENLSRLKRIQILELSQSNINEEHLIEWAKQLPQLTYIWKVVELCHA